MQRDSNPEDEFINRDSETGVKINRYLSAMEAMRFIGAVIVSECDEILLHKGYGFADRSARIL